MLPEAFFAAAGRHVGRRGIKKIIRSDQKKNPDQQKTQKEGRKEGRKAGSQEGRKGRKEARKEGEGRKGRRKEGRKEGSKEGRGRKERTKEGRKAGRKEGRGFVVYVWCLGLLIIFKACFSMFFSFIKFVLLCDFCIFWSVSLMLICVFLLCYCLAFRSVFDFCVCVCVFFLFFFNKFGNLFLKFWCLCNEWLFVRTVSARCTARFLVTTSTHLETRRDLLLFVGKIQRLNQYFFENGCLSVWPP